MRDFYLVIIKEKPFGQEHIYEIKATTDFTKAQYYKEDYEQFGFIVEIIQQEMDD